MLLNVILCKNLYATEHCYVFGAFVILKLLTVDIYLFISLCVRLMDYIVKAYHGDS